MGKKQFTFSKLQFLFIAINKGFIAPFSRMVYISSVNLRCITELDTGSKDDPYSVQLEVTLLVIHQEGFLATRFISWLCSPLNMCSCVASASPTCEFHKYETSVDKKTTTTVLSELLIKWKPRWKLNFINLTCHSFHPVDIAGPLSFTNKN